ncbi:hypothetical protein [Peptostreptococcus faecalis]|uniref:hypothetical protein n=1 Tax=Peptostreptococcus faecalis TaxID=2045015 RepID=UPI000C7E3240|nr:hypothetical protein [Peptostreptococcus faecalis]
MKNKKILVIENKYRGGSFEENYGKEKISDCEDNRREVICDWINIDENEALEEKGEIFEFIKGNINTITLESDGDWDEPIEYRLSIYTKEEYLDKLKSQYLEEIRKVEELLRGKING